MHLPGFLRRRNFHEVATIAPAQAAAARVYRPRRPAATLLHELVRTNVETWLSTAAERDEYGRAVPLHAEAALRRYLKCGSDRTPMEIHTQKQAA